MPKTFTFSSIEIREALKDTVSTIVDGIRQTLEKTPPELSSDIMDLGITLAGGGALLKGLIVIFKSKQILLRVLLRTH